MAIEPNQPTSMLNRVTAALIHYFQADVQQHE